MTASHAATLRSRRRHRTQQVGFGLLAAATVLTVVPIIFIVVLVLVRGLTAISAEFLLTFPTDGMRSGGILPAIIGTFWLTIGTAVAAVPLGIAAAIYLAEYAPDSRWTRTIRVAIINLAGVPSVVYGLFGLGLFVLFLRFGTSILAGSLTLAIMTLPVVISTTEEALPRRAEQLPSREHLPRRNSLADSPPHRLAAGAIRDHDGRCPWAGACRGRDSPNSLHRRRVLPPDATDFPARSNHGPAVPPLCHLNPGSRHAHRHSVWHRRSLACVCPPDEPHCHSHPLPLPRQATMVDMAGSPAAAGPDLAIKIVIEHLSLTYSDGKESLKDINLALPANTINVLFGPAGGGKSSLLRSINRLNDLTDVVHQSGHVWLDGMRRARPGGGCHRPAPAGGDGLRSTGCPSHERPTKHDLWS